MGVPYEGRTALHPGASFAPKAIRAALDATEDREGTELRFVSDLPRRFRPDAEVELPLMEAEIDGCGGAKGTLFLGGDHTVTLAAARALRTQVESFVVLYLDAHLDMRDRWRRERFSHACTARRLLEEGFRVVHVGARVAAAGEEPPLPDPFPELPETPLYISLDMDVLDPSVAPAVGNPEPGGMSLEQVRDYIARCEDRLLAADIVEYIPGLERGYATASVAAHLAHDLLETLNRCSL